MKKPIYLDYSATTPVDQRVIDKMIQYLSYHGIFGNPSSHSHEYGWQAEEAVDIARQNISNLINVQPNEIIFTSGATESNNLALKGIAYSYRFKEKNIITSMTEHNSILNTCNYLEKEGIKIIRIKPNVNGIITCDQLEKEINKNTILVSLMHVNNETGIIQDIAAFSNLCYNKKVIFHVDASQSLGKLPIDLSLIPIDLMSFSSHKVYGPKGIGGLFIRNKIKKIINAQIHGGGQEYNIRSGTLPVHQIIGMSEAYNIMSQSTKEMIRLKILRNHLWNELKKNNSIIINGCFEKSISTILNISICNINSEKLIFMLKDLALSTSSACTSNNSNSSHVLYAMGLKQDIIQSSIRFSIGRFTTIKDIDFIIKKINTLLIN